MFLIFLCAFHFSFCAWEWVNQWKASVRVRRLKFCSKDGYWDPLSQKAEPYLKVFVNGYLFETAKACQDCSTNTWHSVSGYGERTGTEAELQIVAIEMWDEDADNNDHMYTGTFSLSDYKSYGGTFQFDTACGCGSVGVTVGLWPVATAACSLRSASSSFPTCQSPADSYVGKNPSCGRLLDPAGSGTYLNRCVDSTKCGTNLTGNTASNGNCNFKPCKVLERRVNSTHTYPCGEKTCYGQVGTKEIPALSTICESSCAMPTLFQPNSNTGKCEFKACASRVANTSMSYPCGTSDCYQQISNGGTGSGTRDKSCASSCDSNHFEVGPNFRCVLLACEQRTPVSSLRSPCGTTDCYQRPNMTCGFSCPDHYFKTDDGRCSSVPCNIREPVNGNCKTSEGGHPDDEPFCGFYAEEDSTPPFSGCVLCPDAHFRSADGVCVPKTCSERVTNTTAKLLCGSADCYVQPKILDECDEISGSCSEIYYDPNENVTDGVKCAGNCPEFYAENTQGICIIVPCLQRIPTNKTCRPDAAFAENEPTCGYYSESGTDQGGCVYCPENQYRSVDGVCVLKDCAARVPDPTAELPCAEPSCLLYPDNTSTCVTKCPEFFENPATPGVCTLLPCLERIPTDRNCRPDAAFAENEPNCGFYSENNSTDQGECVYCFETHYENTNGICVLKDCATRTLSAVADIPCGELTCLLLPSGSGCDRQCPTNVSTADIQSGMCKYLMCEQRFKDDVFGCGSDCFLGEDGLKCVAEDPNKAKSKAPFPWWIIAVVVPVVAVSIAVVVVVLVIRMRTHKETPKEEPSQQQEGTEMAADNGEGTSNDSSMPLAMGKPVVLLEEGGVKAYPGEDAGDDTGHWI